MISIVMPVYNGEKYVKESIDSILAQTYRDFELIIVDDASTDRTSEIINAYAQKDSRVRVFRNANNQKLPKTLNIGFAKCKGEFYTWTSDDNRYYATAFERMLETLKKDEEVDFVFAREEYIDGNGNKIGIQENVADLDELFCRSIMSGCFLYKKEIHDRLGGYDESKFLIEDYDFFRRAYKEFNFKYIPETLYSYRRHSGSLSDTKMIEVRKRKIQLLEEELDRESAEKIRNKICRELADSYYEISDIYMLAVKKAGSKEYGRLRRFKVKSFIRGIKKKLLG